MRLQGTDGIRGVTRLTGDLSCREPSPVRIFLDSGILTEDFFEIYCFGLCQYLLRSGRIRPEGEVIIGWDPRDRSGEFVSRSIAGVRRAGLEARTLGVVPTPMVPITMAYWGSGAGIAITASHNPADQNGIKIFLTPGGLKPLPEEEEEISGLVLGLKDVRAQRETGKEREWKEEARRLALDFHTDPSNSWISAEHGLPPLTLVVDSSNGACSGLAAGIFRDAGVREVVEVNDSPDEGINRNCGVTALENVSLIIPESLREPSGIFTQNRFVKTLFEAGRENRGKGGNATGGISFDGDGDRFLIALYDPEQDAVRLLSGDEAAVHQAAFLKRSDPERWGNALFVNTVESDLQGSLKAASMGFEVRRTGVGDKWLLRKAKDYADRFAVGSERSGHLITEGFLINERKERVSVFAGNGIKGGLNTLAAIFSESGRRQGWIQRAAHPFTPGFHKIRYVYYTDREKWRRGSMAWKRAQQLIEEEAMQILPGAASLRQRRFREEPDLLYCEILDGKERVLASLHVRNSGTEDKTGITVKGTPANRDSLLELAESVLKLLAREIKNPDHPYCKAQKRLFDRLYPDKIRGRDTLADLCPAGVSPDRLLKEAGEKEGMLRRTGSGYQLTKTGRSCFQGI